MRERCCEEELAAQSVGRLEQSDLVAPQRRDPGGLHAGRPAADNGDLAWMHSPSQRAELGLPLPTGLRIHGTVDMGRERPAVLVETDAGPDRLAQPSARLDGECGVGNEGPGHSDEIGDALRQQPLGRLGRCHLLADDDGKAAFAAHDAGHPRRRSFGERHVLDVAASHPDREAEIVDCAGHRERSSYGGRVAHCEAAGDLFVRRQTDADQEPVSATLADPLDRLLQEPQPFLRRAAPAVRAVVGGRRQELGQQIAVSGMELDTIIAGCLQVSLRHPRSPAQGPGSRRHPGRGADRGPGRPA